MSAGGLKFDAGKLRWSMLPWGAVEWCVRVLEFGAKKYAPDSWQRVEDGKKRYFDALIRHTAEIAKGNPMDAETKLPHLAHIAVNALFCLYLEQQDGYLSGDN